MVAVVVVKGARGAGGILSWKPCRAFLYLEITNAGVSCRRSTFNSLPELSEESERKKKEERGRETRKKKEHGWQRADSSFRPDFQVLFGAKGAK